MDNPGILNNKSLLLLLSGNAASHIGLQGVRLAYPLLTLIVTGSPLSTGVVTFAMTLPSLIFELPAGVASDYWDRRRILIMCQRMGLAATLLAIAVITVHPPGLTLFLAAAAFVEGTAYVFFNNSELGLVRDIVTEAERPTAFSLLEAEQPLANIVGRLVGSATLGMARSLPFLANAATYLYCLWTLSKVRTRALDDSDVGPPKHARIWEWNYAWSGVRVIWEEPFTRGSTILTGATNLIIQIFILLITVKVKDSGHSTWAIGVVLSSSGLGGLLAAVPAARLAGRVDTRILLTGIVWTWAALCAMITISSSLLVLSICWVGVGFVGSIENVATILYRVRVFPEDFVGRVYGANKLITHGGTAVGSLLAGAMLSIFGVSITGWILVAGMALAARYARRLPMPQPAEPLPAEPLPPGLTRKSSAEQPSHANWITQLSSKQPRQPG